MFDYLGIALNHHDALSDAEACAQIAMLTLSQSANISAIGER